MKKIIFTGLDREVTEQGIRDALEKVGPVHRIDIIRDGDPNAPVVVVEMAISDEAAYQLTTRVTDYWHDGHHINARLLLH